MNYGQHGRSTLYLSISSCPSLQINVQSHHSVIVNLKKKVITCPWVVLFLFLFYREILKSMWYGLSHV